MSLDNQLSNSGTPTAPVNQEVVSMRTAAELAEQVRVGVEAQLTIDGIKSDLVGPASALKVFSILNLSGSLSEKQIHYWARALNAINEKRAKDSANDDLYNAAA
jgi:hypothetical protein